MNTRGLLLVAVGVTLVSCIGEDDKGHLIYEGQSSSPPGFDIWNVALDEGVAFGAPVNLTQSAGDDVDADWNQAEKKVAFASNRTGNYDIYKMDADGSNQFQVTTGPHMDRFPSWDPGADHIAYATNEDVDFEIFRVVANGSHKSQLTHNDCLDTEPAWSPDGTRIAFVSSCAGGHDLEIYVMDTTGQGITRLTTRPSMDDFHPSWSPDSARIVFESVPAGGSAHVNTEIVIMNADGTGLHLATTATLAGDLVQPAWSSSGNLIAVAKVDASGDYNLYIVDAGNGAVSIVLNEPLTQWSPTWGDPN